MGLLDGMNNKCNGKRIPPTVALDVLEQEIRKTEFNVVV